jgi:ribosomal protein S24E
VKQIEVIHPELGGVSKAQLKEKLAKQLKVKEDCITIYGLRAKFGGGRSTGFALIYDNHDLLKKYDSKKQLRKVSRLLISSFLSVCFASDFITNYLGRHRNQTQGRTQSPQGTQDQSRQGQGHQEGLRLDRQEEEVSAPVG